MPRVIVTKPFRLQLGDNKEPIQFKAGAQDISDELLEHWYVKAHVEEVTSDTDAPGEDPSAALQARVAELETEVARLMGNQVPDGIDVPALQARVAELETEVAQLKLTPPAQPVAAGPAPVAKARR